MPWARSRPHYSGRIVPSRPLQAAATVAFGHAILPLINRVALLLTFNYKPLKYCLAWPCSSSIDVFGSFLSFFFSSSVLCPVTIRQGSEQAEIALHSWPMSQSLLQRPATMTMERGLSEVKKPMDYVNLNLGRST